MYLHDVLFTRPRGTEERHELTDSHELPIIRPGRNCTGDLQVMGLVSWLLLYGA